MRSMVKIIRHCFASFRLCTFLLHIWNTCILLHISRQRRKESKQPKSIPLLLCSCQSGFCSEKVNIGNIFIILILIIIVIISSSSISSLNNLPHTLPSSSFDDDILPSSPPLADMILCKPKWHSWCSSRFPPPSSSPPASFSSFAQMWFVSPGFPLIFTLFKCSLCIVHIHLSPHTITTDWKLYFNCW